MTVQPAQRDRKRHRTIAEVLRGAIVRGELQPGSRLPTRQELNRHHRAGLTAIQRAMEDLRQDGFVEPRGKLGTFVVARPPHLFRYGLVNAHTGPSRFWEALQQVAVEIAAERSGTVENFHTPVGGASAGKDLQALVKDVQAHRLAGLVFVFEVPKSLEGTDLLKRRDLPRVLIGNEFVGDIPLVDLDCQQWVDKTFEHMVSRNRRRVAVVGNARAIQMAERAASSRGLTLRPSWLHVISAESFVTVRHITRLLMDLEDERRPDGLAICDDHMVEHALAGLIDAGVRVPQDLEVVTHCNYPLMTPSVVQVTRLGYDGREIMRACMDLIDQQRQGHRPQAVTKIPPHFEFEIGNRQATPLAI